jgi:hypothetical protein
MMIKSGDVMIEFREHATIFILLPSGMIIGPAGWAVDRDGHRFRIPEHAPEAFRIVQIGFELADSAEACQYPEAKAALLQSAEELIKTGRQMLQCTIDEIEQQAYSGA